MPPAAYVDFDASQFLFIHIYSSFCYGRMTFEIHNKRFKLIFTILHVFELRKK